MPFVLLFRAEKKHAIAKRKRILQLLPSRISRHDQSALALIGQDLKESMALLLLALTSGRFVIGRPDAFCCDCFIFAIAYTIPLAEPMAIAETLGRVTGASKNIKPLTAMGILLRAPAMEYVAAEVTRTHRAEAKEMKTVPSPVRTMAMMRLVRVAGGKFFWRFTEDQSSTRREAMTRIGIVRRLL